MSQAAWEAAVDAALDIAKACDVTQQEFIDYASDEAERDLLPISPRPSFQAEGPHFKASTPIPTPMETE